VRQLYVGNLPFRMSEDDLADFLGPSDIRDIHFPRDFELDRPKGYAYVELNTREALVRVLALDGQSADGRAIKIDVATARDRDRKSRPTENSWFTEKRADRSRYVPPAPCCDREGVLTDDPS
jgi:translation initiation factor 4B